MNTQAKYCSFSMFVLATAFALAAGGSAFAQTSVGTAFTYQAQLKQGGEPLNDTADFEFTLWDDPNSTSPNHLVAGPVPVNNVSVSNGLFTTMLDFGEEPWVPNEARWLQIEVRSPSGAGEFTTLEPRQELAPTPFSLATRGICVDADGNVGIGTDAPTDKLHVMGALRVGNSIHIDDTTDTITATSGTISFDDENLITMGDVGFGDDDPLARLHVEGLDLGLDPNDVFHKENILVEGAYAWLGLHSGDVGDHGSGLTFAEHDVSTGDPTNSWSIYRKSSGSGGDLKITYGSDTDPTANAQQLCIRPDGTTLLVPRTGKVGVGMSATDDPAAMLHLEGGLGIPGAQGYLASFENNIFVEADRPWLSMYTDNELGHDVGICFGMIDQSPFDQDTKWAIYRDRGDDLFITHGDNEDPTANEDMLRILQDGDTLLAPEHGDVGVGLDDDPLAKLHVQGLSGLGLDPNDVFDKEDILVEGGYAWLGLHSADAYNYGSGLTFAEHDVFAGPTNTWSIYRRSTGNVGDLNITYGPNTNPTANDKMLRILTDGTMILEHDGNERISLKPKSTRGEIALAGSGAEAVLASNRLSFGATSSDAYVSMWVDSYGGAYVKLNSAAGEQGTISLNGETGKLSAKVVEITGADLAEKFPVSEESKPGTVVEIDPDNPGELRVARGAYNRRVAGVVSGANNLPTGAVLGNLPESDDALPVALSGRVWCWCDASYGPIEPGDLLTTSDTPGHAMKVTDHPKAQGAVIGKAMTSLDSGCGLVLTLVSLQ